MNIRNRSWVIAVVLSTAGCSSQPPPPPELRAVVVEAPQPMAGPSGAEVYPGAVRARHEADLSFRVPGKIARRQAELGTRVESGAVLAELDPEDAQLNLEAAESALTAASADAQLARSEDRRYRELLAKGYVGQSAVDARINALRLAEADAASQTKRAEGERFVEEPLRDRVAHRVLVELVPQPRGHVAAGPRDQDGNRRPRHRARPATRPARSTRISSRVALPYPFWAGNVTVRLSPGYIAPTLLIAETYPLSVHWSITWNSSTGRSPWRSPSPRAC